MKYAPLLIHIVSGLTIRSVNLYSFRVYPAVIGKSWIPVRSINFLDPFLDLRRLR